MSIFARWVRRCGRVPTPNRQSRRLGCRVRPHAEQLEDRWVPSTTYLVTSLADTNAPGTLRSAITQLNLTTTGTAASPDQIQFTIGGTIHVTGTPLPALTDIAVIDGTTAPGYGGAPVVTLDGALAGAGANGLTISAGSSTVKGLDVVNFLGNGIRLDTNGSNTILNNYIGITTTGLVAANSANGIFINGTSGNTIGGTVATDSNVVSGNGGDGILIDGPSSSDNLIVANFIGTSATGTAALGNAGNGIRITNGARLNTIGGNTPTATAFTGKPVDGNVISGNGANGVLLTNGAGFNTLSGNFIGTDLAGTHSVGNTLDGVAILNGANNNSLIGTTFPQPPFVYLNLLSGNGGNGLRIQDSNNTTVQANCFGLGDDNITPVPNRLDGVLIEGTSANTQFGGVIPLGNISSANGRNGVEIKDTASGTVCFNTFCGLPAFVATATGNALDGFLITSTGGNNLLRTNVISGNLGNGVHISGNATGVQVGEDIIGMNTSGQSALPNGANGVLIDGNAHDNIIGGLQVSVIFQNTISANGANGIAILGNASGNQVFHSFIGTNILGDTAFGNAGAGVLIGGNAQGNTIGGVAPFDQNLISGNLGGGIMLSAGSHGTQVLGNLIGTDRTGHNPLANQGSGISIVSSDNQIGGTVAGQGNVIAFNTQDGVGIDTGVSNEILGNSIFGNATLGIGLTAGGNHSQPAPVLTAADQPTATTVRMAGTLTAAANTTYRVEIFASSSSTAPGQGQTFLGSLAVTTDANGVALFSFSSALPANAGTSFTATATDPAHNTSAFSAPINAANTTIFAVGADTGGLPQVKIFNADGNLQLAFLAFDAGFRGGVRVAVGRLGGQQVIVAGAGAGGGPNVRVFDAATGQQLAGALGSFFAYSANFSGGVFVAAGDVNGDGFDDIITGTGAGGGPNVKVFSGKDGSVLQSFFAYDAGFLGGVSVAAGFIDGDAHADIITGAGAGGGPQVKVFDGANPAILISSFFAYDAGFRGGVYVAAGNLHGGTTDLIVTGAGAGGGPQVNIFNGVTASQLGSFLAYGAAFRGGVRVGVLNSNGQTDLVTGTGPGGGPQVNIGNSSTRTFTDSFFAFDPLFPGGVFVGGS
ncbi:MAG: hypothetical protein JWO38_7791 [Gemmataceae bacterium]|nr:hypothetical protein [Gemmataceae bacterium]